jgi:purine-binding chemotaxis protein CheW
MEQEELEFDLHDEIEEDSLKDKYLSFRLGKESYGIDIRYVTEIIVMQEITKVPDMPDFIIGVINLRGHVISVMDIRSRFNLEYRDYDDRTCIIVVEVDDIMVGLVVDTVSEVSNIKESDIEPPPKMHSGIKSHYIQGLGKVDNQVKILLDITKILREEELGQLN